VAASHDSFTNRPYIKYIVRGNWEVWAVPRLVELYPDICLTTEEKARKKTSVRVAQYHNNEQTHNKSNEQAPYKNRSTLQDMNKHNTLPNKSITTTTRNTEYTTKLRIHN